MAKIKRRNDFSFRIELSGKGVTLRLLPHLRTGLESFPSSGSSRSETSLMMTTPAFQWKVNKGSGFVNVPGDHQWDADRQQRATHQHGHLLTVRDEHRRHQRTPFSLTVLPTPSTNLAVNRGGIAPGGWDTASFATADPWTLTFTVTADTGSAFFENVSKVTFQKGATTLGTRTVSQLKPSPLCALKSCTRKH